MKTIVKMILCVSMMFIIGLAFIVEDTNKYTQLNNDIDVETEEDLDSVEATVSIDLFTDEDKETIDDTSIESTVEDEPIIDDTTQTEETNIEQTEDAEEDSTLSIEVNDTTEEAHVITPGNCGILTIDGVLQCGLDNAVAYNYDGQALIDSTDLAYIYAERDYWCNGGIETVIYQHSNKVFKDLYNVHVGTTAHFCNRDVTCIIADPDGYADEYVVYLGDGTDTYSLDGSNNVIMYTCLHNSHGSDGRYVTIWQ